MASIIYFLIVLEAGLVSWVEDNKAQTFPAVCGWTLQPFLFPKMPVTFFILKRDLLPSILLLFCILTDQTENFLGPLWRNYKGSFLKPEQLKRISSLLSLAARLSLLGHMSLLIVGMMLEFPLGLNFIRVNPLLQQLQDCVRESDLQPHTSAEESSWAWREPPESIISHWPVIDSDMASLSQTLINRDQWVQEKELGSWRWGFILTFKKWGEREKVLG